ncbi:MAG TPA: MFS transporter, partial [Ktedonobacteraceae bacterium]|nr:MFS transporter [Ktedonobacteraceae bacterium]
MSDSLNPEPVIEETQAGLAKSLDTQAVAATSGIPPAHDSYKALRYRNFRLLLISIFISVFAQQMITVAIGWELFERTNSSLVLGGVGLAQIIPIMLLFLPSGYIVDRYSRKLIYLVALAVIGLAILGLGALSALRGSLFLIYSCLVIMGGAQSFSTPTGSVLISQVVPESVFENATTWRTSCSQLAAVLGPTAGGFLIGILGGATLIYFLSGAAFIIVALIVLSMRVRPQAALQKGSQQRSLGVIVDGLRFLGQTQVMLAAITLDL